MKTWIGAVVASALALSSVCAQEAPPVDAATRSALDSLRASTAPKPQVREPDPANVAKMLAAEREHLRALEEAWKEKQPKEQQPK